LLQRAPADAAVLAKGLAVIERNARAQAKIIEDILDVSRIIGGKLQLRLAPCALHEVVAASVDAVVPAAAAKEITLVKDIVAAEPVVVDCDRMQQVCWNLLSNAVKFTPKGGEVKVSLHHADDELVLTVQDSGIGIPKEFLPFIFDRFSQADGSATRRHGGLGLGMAIVRHLIELHGGTVRAESEGPDRGSRFTATLPRRVARPDEQFDNRDGVARADRPVPPQSPGSLPSLAGHHVLLVDDEPDGREFLALLLRQAGANVSTSASGEDAFQRIEKGGVTVLVSDLRMPRMDGLELIRNVRTLKDGWHLPAIAVSSNVRADEAAAALSAGYDLHVGKPIDVAQLITAIDALAGIKAAEASPSVGRPADR
jgi:CheY-like chemotaxis protein